MFRIAYYHTAHAVFAVCSIRLVYVSYTERYTMMTCHTGVKIRLCFFSSKVRLQVNPPKKNLSNVVKAIAVLNCWIL